MSYENCCLVKDYLFHNVNSPLNNYAMKIKKIAIDSKTISKLLRNNNLEKTD